MEVYYLLWKVENGVFRFWDSKAYNFRVDESIAPVVIDDHSNEDVEICREVAIAAVAAEVGVDDDDDVEDWVCSTQLMFRYHSHLVVGAAEDRRVWLYGTLP